MESSLPIHLAFLNDAAHLIAQTAPESSAYLMRHRSELLLNNGMELNPTQRQHICDGCGHIMVPGLDSCLGFEAAQTLRKKNKNKNKNDASKTPDSRTKGPASIPAQSRPTNGMRHPVRKMMRCGNCHQTTSIAMPPPTKITRHQTKADSRGQKSEVGAKPTPTFTQKRSEDVPKPSANANSKKRAKNRKAGLQALLSQAQSSQGGRTLSLADFAKR